MPTLTSSTLIGNSFKSLYGLLTGASGVTDPASRSIARTAWVFPEFPDENGDDWPGYPIITIKVDASYSPLLFNRQGRDIKISFMITVFASKNERVDSISDDILNIINANQSTLEAFKMFNPTLTSSATTTDFRTPEDKIHMKTMFVDYEVKSL